MAALPQSVAPEFTEAVHDALKLWHADRSSASPLHDLYLVLAALRRSDSNIRRATNQVLEDGLTALTIEHPEDGRLLRARFIDRKATHVVARDLNVSEGWVYTLQRDAIDRLAKAIQTTEFAARAAQEAVLQARLEPPTYARLFGVEAHIAELSRVLAAETPQLVAVTGLGGIGKTTLADALLRRLVREAAFDDFGWVSARQQLFHPGGAIVPLKQPALTADALIEALAEQLLEDRLLAASLSVAQATAALQAQLKRTDLRCLIVVDNLETVRDIENLLPILRDLAGHAARFVLTSRESLYAEPDVYSYVLPELSEPDALELVREEARLRNVPALFMATYEDLRPIYATVGGNPLALRLVVGQTSVHALDTVLHDLTAARGHRAGSLYEYIYRRAWDGLDEPSRQVLLATLLTPRGTLDELSEITGMRPEDVADCLEKLVTRSLVDARGGIRERQYTVHALTRTFLHEQVVKWH